MNKEELQKQLLNNADDFLTAIIEKTNDNELDLSELNIIQINLGNYDIHKFIKLNLNKNLLTSLSFVPIHIISLNISFNIFKNINFIKELINLQELNFSYNENINIDNDIFSNLIELQSIDMAGNNLNNIANVLFINLNKLNRLNIAGNNITSIIDIVLPTSVNFINATYNNISKDEQEIMSKRLNKIIF